MKTPAYDLLEGSIDYAGLYPPTKFPLATAVREYLALLGSEAEWLTNRFVCPASQRAQVSEMFRQALAEQGQEGLGQDDPFPLALVGSPDPALGQFDIDADALLATDIVTATAFEIRLPSAGEGLAAALGGLKGLLRKVEKADVAVFVELPWTEDLLDGMHQIAEVGEEIGFKARTGGVIADAFPSPKDVARFIVEAAALEAPFKFTAGLHEPIRYQDDSLGVVRHGFVNVFVASALAVTQYLSAAEVAQILEITDGSAFSVTEEAIEVAGHRLVLDEIHEFRAIFGGFGSCSVQEPIAGLAKMGWA